MNDIHYLTKEGHLKIIEEMETLKERRKLVTNRIEDAIKMGDLSENAEYTDAKDEQAFVEGRIAEIDAILKSSEIIKKKRTHTTVTVGSTVKVKWEGREKTFTIVGPEEADPANGVISNESPLGKAFLGKKKDDKVPVNTPRGEVMYSILEIS